MARNARPKALLDGVLAEAVPVQMGRLHAVVTPDGVGPCDDVRSVCHDLRGHLATIGMIAAGFSTDDLPAAAAARLETLVAELETAREMAHRVVSHRRVVGTFDLASVITSCVERAAFLTGCEIRCHLEPTVIVGDELQLVRMLDNLLENATRAAGPTGRVEVLVSHEIVLPGQPFTHRRRAEDRQPSSRALVLIADDGPGFGRAPAGVASLGLKVVRAVLAELGGELQIGQSAMGGALVTAVIPCWSA